MIPKPNHKRRAPRQDKRNKFSDQVRKRVWSFYNGTCQLCFRTGEEIHHNKYRSQMGRGVFTNAILLCHQCHRRVHDDSNLRRHLFDSYVDKFGKYFFMDEYDIEKLQEDEHVKKWLEWNRS